MEVEGKCEHCGQKLKLVIEKDISGSMKQMFDRALEKLEPRILCGNCGEMTAFEKEGGSG